MICLPLMLASNSNAVVLCRWMDPTRHPIAPSIAERLREAMQSVGPQKEYTWNVMIAKKSTGSGHWKQSVCRKGTSLLIGCWAVVVLHAGAGSALAASPTVRTADDAGGTIVRKEFATLREAASQAREGTQIQLGQASYFIDNPVVIAKDGVSIVGKGWNKTVIYPKNAGQPIFRLAADRLTVANLTIDAKVQGASGRATFAILIEEGYGGCTVSRTRILNTGGSSILGRAVTDCFIHRNLIGNAGDDAIQLRGDGLYVIGNAMIRYFDEAVDAAFGKHIVVSNNYLENGRIGLVVDYADDPVVSGNIVEDQLQQGIVVASRGGGIITNNTVRNGGSMAFYLDSPLLIEANRVEGKHKVGIRVIDMQQAIIRRNVISDADMKFEIIRGKSGPTGASKHPSSPAEDLVTGPEGVGQHGNQEQTANCNADDALCLSESWKVGAEVSGYWTREKINLARAALSRETFDFFSGGITVKGRSSRDVDVADQVAGFLQSNNPGFLSVQVDGSTMRSEITDDLYATLKGSSLSKGVVRWPYLMFKREAGSFPVWHLSFQGSDVATVSPRRGGAGVRITLMREGKPRFRDRLNLWLDRVALWALKASR